MTSALADFMIKRGTKVILVRKIMWGIGKNFVVFFNISIFTIPIYKLVIFRAYLLRCDWLFCWVYKLPPGGSGSNSVVLMGRCYGVR